MNEQGPSSGRLPALPIRSTKITFRLEWLILVLAIFYAVVQAGVRWGLGARVQQARFVEFLGGSDPSFFFLLVVLVLALKAWTDKLVAKGARVAMYALAATAVSAIPVQTEVIGNRYWERAGERWLLSDSGGPDSFGRDSVALLEELQTGAVKAVDGRVPLSALSKYSTLNRWHFTSCTYDPEIPRLYFRLEGYDQIELVPDQIGWRISRIRHAGYANDWSFHYTPATGGVRLFSALLKMYASGQGFFLPFVSRHSSFPAGVADGT